MDFGDSARLRVFTGRFAWNLSGISLLGSLRGSITPFAKPIGAVRIDRVRRVGALKRFR